MDAPLHMLKDGKTAFAVSAGTFFRQMSSYFCSRAKLIDAPLLEGKQIEKGDIVFIFTGFYKNSATLNIMNLIRKSAKSLL